MARNIPVVKPILRANDQVAQDNHALLNDQNTFAVNIMASPGAGKTSLILRTIEALQGTPRIGVIEGDVASQVDANKVAESGVPVVQINTEGGCHLEAAMVRQALAKLPLGDIDLLFIENVGNIVCPADFPLGTTMRVMVISVTEGDDMVRKHPMIFQCLDLAVINKIDLAEIMEVDPQGLVEDIKAVDPGLHVVLTDARHGEGIQELVEAMGLTNVRN